VFVSIDLFLFYIFWDAVLIPMYFLIGIWGYERRIYAAVKFILYTMVGSILMLVAIIGLSYAHRRRRGSQTFNLLELYGTPLSMAMEKWFFLAFALAFLIKVPLFPFHTWLPDAHVEAPTAGSVILAGVMLKMGTYGLLRFAFPLFPNARAVLRALHRRPRRHRHHLRRAGRDGAAGHEEAGAPYSSVSHLGFVVLGLCAGERLTGGPGRGLPDAEPRRQHRAGSHGSSACCSRIGRHTRLISEFGGSRESIPRLVAAFLHVHALVDCTAE
jgi:NADH-quinone oxidoreductase subunit M